ncbi:cis-aconitate decarboxylase-like [Mytilus californianus]|uniref:cis-aconitate decarboxylase-like n=1 Tax=Mytilus californianus TaxID=6549 RepID=UPI002247CC87|nr:cis-aconitate decarboxylase-like [Mytilus californianus]
MMKYTTARHVTRVLGCGNIKVLRALMRNQSTTVLNDVQRYSAYPPQDLTTLLSDHVAEFSYDDLSDKVIHRSKRMILDTIGVGLIGSQTDIAATFREFAMETHGVNKHAKALVWGTEHLKMSPPMAAYLNGCSTHSMDFDDTWHPATHPSGPVLPSILALADSLPKSLQPTLQDILVAFNIGIQVQGALLRCSANARNIPNRLHPPAIVGVMGSAAASARLLGLGTWKCRHAMAIAASFAGAPMANAGTMTKPLHSGKSARFGLEAALLADKGIEGNSQILDMVSGFGAFYEDYDPEILITILETADNVLLHDQDIAIKRYPCHLGMHWGIDAALSAREQLQNKIGNFSFNDIEGIKIIAPKSKYINRQIPNSEHEGRHSFQFTVCSALLDGIITPETFRQQYRERQSVTNLLEKTAVETPDDNIPSFADMYVNVLVQLKDGTFEESLCSTPYGHWRYPLTDKDVQKKFLKNTNFLKGETGNDIINLVSSMDKNTSANELSQMLHR